MGNKNSTTFSERLGKATKDSQKLGCEVLSGLMGQVIKKALFGAKDSQEEKTDVGNAQPALENSPQQQMEI